MSLLFLRRQLHARDRYKMSRDGLLAATTDNELLTTLTHGHRFDFRFEQPPYVSVRLSVRKTLIGPSRVIGAI